MKKFGRSLQAMTEGYSAARVKVIEGMIGYCYTHHQSVTIN